MEELKKGKVKKINNKKIREIENTKFHILVETDEIIVDEHGKKHHQKAWLPFDKEISAGSIKKPNKTIFGVKWDIPSGKPDGAGIVDFRKMFKGFGLG